MFLTFTTLTGYAFTNSKALPEADYGQRYAAVERDENYYVGIHSEVKPCGGVPALYVNDKVFPSVAYMTYLEQYNAYEDFAAAGYNFYSVPVLFAGRWISITDGFTPFKQGIYDTEGEPDYSLMDEAVERILAACPDAYIMPRVNICMPLWWEQAHPDDLNYRADGTPCRESFYSAQWRADAEEMLRAFVQYVNQQDYADHIVGYQIAGGNTEEWFHFDLNGGYGAIAQEGFADFIAQYYPDEHYEGLPDMALLKKSRNYLKNPHLSRFMEYCGFVVADAICNFAHAVKEETGNNVVVGTFYGYSLEVTSPLHGSHALRLILNDPNVDFISSPNSYLGVRVPTADWTEMYPADSVRLHGKMCFQENDIRTHLTKLLGDKDPTIDPLYNLNADIWKGLSTKELAVNMVRKSFARQLIKGNAFWWFDMWGGWYQDADLMAQMQQYRNIYMESLNAPNRKGKAEIAVFVDETGYKYLTDNSLRNSIYTQRTALGQIGAPYDCYDLSDFDAVYQNYKAVMFLTPAKTQALQGAVKTCRAQKKPFLMANSMKKSFSVKELRAFCAVNDVYIYCESDDILYINDSYLAICAVTEGEKTIRFPEARTVTSLTDGSKRRVTTDTFTVHLSKGETQIYALQ